MNASLRLVLSWVCVGGCGMALLRWSRQPQHVLHAPASKTWSEFWQTEEPVPSGGEVHTAATQALYAQRRQLEELRAAYHAQGPRITNKEKGQMTDARQYLRDMQVEFGPQFVDMQLDCLARRSSRIVAANVVPIRPLLVSEDPPAASWFVVPGPYLKDSKRVIFRVSEADDPTSFRMLQEVQRANQYAVAEYNR